MSSKGATQTGTSTSTNGPPNWAQPYYAGGMQAAQDLYGSSPGPTPYPGAQVAPLSPLQEQSLGQIAQAAQSNPYNQLAGNYFNALESGAMLDPASNTALSGMANTGANQVQARLAQEFAGHPGNTGSQAVQNDERNVVQNQLYGGAYNTTIGNMAHALSQANPLTLGQYIPSQMLMSAGSQVQGQAQNVMNANANTYNQYQQLPYQQLSNYMSGIAGVPVGTQTQAPIMANPMAGAAAGASAGTAIEPGWGTLIGGILGAFASGAQ